MKNEIETTKTFQERMFERIREQMGELLSEDDLKSIVSSAIQKAFFEPTERQNGYHAEKIEPVFITLIRKEMEPKITIAIRDWLTTHPEEVTKAINETIAKGMFGLIQQHIETKTFQPMQQLADQLRMKGILG